MGAWRGRFGDVKSRFGGESDLGKCWDYMELWRGRMIWSISAREPHSPQVFSRACFPNAALYVA